MDQCRKEAVLQLEFYCISTCLCLLLCLRSTILRVPYLLVWMQVPIPQACKMIFQSANFCKLQLHEEGKVALSGRYYLKENINRNTFSVISFTKLIYHSSRRIGFWSISAVAQLHFYPLLLLRVFILLSNRKRINLTNKQKRSFFIMITNLKYVKFK